MRAACSGKNDFTVSRYKFLTEKNRRIIVSLLLKKSSMKDVVYL